MEVLWVLRRKFSYIYRCPRPGISSERMYEVARDDSIPITGGTPLLFADCSASSYDLIRITHLGRYLPALRFVYGRGFPLISQLDEPGSLPLISLALMRRLRTCGLSRFRIWYRAECCELLTMIGEQVKPRTTKSEFKTLLFYNVQYILKCVP